VVFLLSPIHCGIVRDPPSPGSTPENKDLHDSTPGLILRSPDPPMTRCPPLRSIMILKDLHDASKIGVDLRGLPFPRPCLFSASQRLRGEPCLSDFGDSGDRRALRAHPTRSFLLFVANKSTSANRSLHHACATLAWPLGDPRETQTQSQAGRGSWAVFIYPITKLPIYSFCR
jgi:hypothetical protein